MPLQHRIYVYDKQSNAARAMLEGCGLSFVCTSFMRVSTRYQLAGLPVGCGTFVVIRGHIDPVPEELMIAVEIAGLVVMTLDDSLVRARVSEPA